MKADHMLDLVASSPIAASRKEREVWLGLFDENAAIEDPAGSVPFIGMGHGRGLADFYDIFIAHSDISFVSEYDYVCGRHVVRDGTIIVDMKESPRLTIPVFLRYEVSESGKIKSLRAHWKPVSAIFKAISCRPGGPKYLADIVKQLYTTTGVRGIGGFAQAAAPAAIGSRITLWKLKDYLQVGRYSDAVSLFSFLDGGEIILYSKDMETHPAGYLTMGEFKLISVDKLIDGGHFLSLRCDLLLSGRKRSGVAVFTFTTAGFRIRKLEIFIDEA
jgi:steroid Delta-isomerase